MNSEKKIIDFDHTRDFFPCAFFRVRKWCWVIFFFGFNDTIFFFIRRRKIRRRRRCVPCLHVCVWVTSGYSREQHCLRVDDEEGKARIFLQSVSVLLSRGKIFLVPVCYQIFGHMEGAIFFLQDKNRSSEQLIWASAHSMSKVGSASKWEHIERNSMVKT